MGRSTGVSEDALVHVATRTLGLNEVKHFDPLQYIEKKDVKKMDLFIQYAIAAAQFAMDDSKLVVTPENAQDVRDIEVLRAAIRRARSRCSTRRPWRWPTAPEIIVSIR